MKAKFNLFSILIIFIVLTNCNNKHKEMEKIIFLHHSTGKVIWNGDVNRYVRKLTQRSQVKTLFNQYNRKHNTAYSITEQAFPKSSPYGWSNFPYDYYNVWVKNAGNQYYMEEPTLEILTKWYDIIILKHCYPVCHILEDTGNPQIDSNEKRLENYKLQYIALREKMNEFPNNKFIVWTPAAVVKNNLTLEEAKRAREFYDWIINDWDKKNDNIYIWDFYKLETDLELFLKDEYAADKDDSHPNKKFASKVAPLFTQFIIDVIEGKID